MHIIKIGGYDLSSEQKIDLGTLFQLASFLKSDIGENKEYDRALIELLTDVCGLPPENRKDVAKYLEIEGIDLS